MPIANNIPKIANMTKTPIFWKYCPNGHRTYNFREPVVQARCARCGDQLFDCCAKCNAQIAGTFSYGNYYEHLEKIYYNTPEKPKFCVSCGIAFPWTVKDHKRVDDAGFWGLMHPVVVSIAKSRFENGHYADAIESAAKEFNQKVKLLYRERTGREADGVTLMQKAFSPKEPTFMIADVSTESGQNIQRGFMDLCTATVALVRNPAAHANLTIDSNEAIHKLMLVSQVFKLFDGRISNDSQDTANDGDPKSSTVG